MNWPAVLTTEMLSAIMEKHSQSLNHEAAMHKFIQKKKGSN